MAQCAVSFFLPVFSLRQILIIKSEHLREITKLTQNRNWTNLDGKLDFVKALTNIDLTLFLTSPKQNRKFFEKNFFSPNEKFFYFFSKILRNARKPNNDAGLQNPNLRPILSKSGIFPKLQWILGMPKIISI